ncbi:DUF924 family protein [Pelomonas sp. SE-A7]|uniref:DUF924 family protein n=1 Tax=Pelomonas sp. SE-A7 TaxID=3054953 RepID=UPI00259CC891|nr:DUF924 family protein [Pelomonas sp. SE-A7]MDM4765603.1 DUF924 family protein [Pelomonas sp. SE-A7]
MGDEQQHELDIRPRTGGFSAEVDGHALELDVMRSGDQLVFHHTETAPELRGRGLAGRMVEHGLLWAAEQERQVIASCSYVALWLRKHPDWQRLTEPVEVQQLLNFWFGALGSAEHGQVRGEWFRKSAAFDDQIRQRFGAQLEAALSSGLELWAKTPWGSVARILLLDQLTRNAFRGTARSFAGDALALKTSLALLDGGQYAQLGTLQRWFALMPLEHAEDLALQDRSVAEFRKLAAEDLRLQGAFDYAIKHREVIQRFGRFPHRNAILGRTSTVEELDYLAQPGAGF